MSKETRKLIRQLNKCKRHTQVGSEERREINRKIREIKKENKTEINPMKERLMDQVCKLDPWYATHRNNLYKFSEIELSKYIKRYEKK